VIDNMGFSKEFSEAPKYCESSSSGLYKQNRNTRQTFLAQGQGSSSIVIGSDKTLETEPESDLNVVKYGKPFLDALFVSSSDLAKGQRVFHLEDRKNIEVFIKGGMEGIDLDIYQERVLECVLRRFTEAGFPEWISLMERDLFTGTGVERVQTKRGKTEFPGRETQRLRGALANLGCTNYPIMVKAFEKYDPRLRQNIYSLEGSFAPLLAVRWVYRGVTENELREFKNEVRGTKAGFHRRFRYWRIKLNPVILAGISNGNFRLLPGNIYKQIRDHKPGRVLRAEILFIKWLHKHGKGKAEIRINWLNLADDLKLGPTLKRRHFREARAVVTRLYELGKDQGYIEHYQVALPSDRTQDRTVDALFLNPKRFYHLKGFLPA
jgi:hypothetical protein